MKALEPNNRNNLECLCSRDHKRGLLHSFAVERKLKTNTASRHGTHEHIIAHMQAFED